MEQNIEIGTREAKNTALVNQAVELITTMPGLSNEKIAQELNISRTHLANVMKGEYAQEYLKRELNERKTRIDTWIQELYNTKPQNPSNQRFALKIEADLARALADKIYPTKTETLNLNVNIDLNKLQQFQQDIYQTLNNLPPHIRTQFWETYNQITNKHQQTHQP